MKFPHYVKIQEAYRIVFECKIGYVLQLQVKIRNVIFLFSNELLIMICDEKRPFLCLETTVRIFAQWRIFRVFGKKWEFCGGNGIDAVKKHISIYYRVSHCKNVKSFFDHAKFTVWKFKDSSATQFLREIKSGHFGDSKLAI